MWPHHARIISYIVLPYLGMKPMERIPGSPLKWPRKYSHGIPAAIHLSFSIPFPTRGVVSLFFPFFPCYATLATMARRYKGRYKPYYARILFDNEDQRPFSSPRRFLITTYLGQLIETRDWLRVYMYIYTHKYFGKKSRRYGCHARNTRGWILPAANYFLLSSGCYISGWGEEE